MEIALPFRLGKRECPRFLRWVPAVASGPPQFSPLRKDSNTNALRFIVESGGRQSKNEFRRVSHLSAPRVTQESPKW